MRGKAHFRGQSHRTFSWKWQSWKVRGPTKLGFLTSDAGNALGPALLPVLGTLARRMLKDLSNLMTRPGTNPRKRFSWSLVLPDDPMALLA